MQPGEDAAREEIAEDSSQRHLAAAVNEALKTKRFAYILLFT